uniref:Ankyrin repeat protein n=1 Tax=Pithovirus LCPAC401 TaxID=2506595 RepID=A0A481Z944_9VIRU|nr:MAG: ankyrin repeat protein [Pithovirus LCPAC401]
METLRSKLKCKDCEELIFEFLINGDDYTSFTLDDLKLFSTKIKNWNECMKCGVIKNVEFIEYCESMIPEESRKRAYAGCMAFSSKMGNLIMLKYFEAKDDYEKETWRWIMNCAASSEEFMIDKRVKKEDTLEVFKYVELKIRDGKYGYVYFAERIDILEYIWEHGYNTNWKEYMETSTKDNKLKIFKWIEFKVLEEDIKWGYFLECCTQRAAFDTYRYCRSKYKWKIPFDHFLYNVSSKGHFEMFKHIISEYDESKSDEKLDWKKYLKNVAGTRNFEMFRYIVLKHGKSELDWKEYMIIISKSNRVYDDAFSVFEDSVESGFNLFKYCAGKAESPNYLECMLNAMLVGFFRIASFCGESLDSEIEIPWQTCMCEAVINGYMDYIKYIESKAGIERNWDYKALIKGAAYWNELDSLKYIEEKMNKQGESINWEEVLESCNIQDETTVTVYVQIKLGK